MAYVRVMQIKKMKKLVGKYFLLGHLYDVFINFDKEINNRNLFCFSFLCKCIEKKEFFCYNT